LTAYQTNINDVEFTEGGPPEDGWNDMRVQFLINKERGGAKHVVFGRTIFAPGAHHQWHRHAHAEEFQYIVRGQGLALNDGKEVPVKTGDLWFTPANEFHGFRNDSDEEAEMVWGWAGAGSREEAGYEVRDKS
jgi:quercetin dioxygenase-like cupin family protein